jgi:hypothetical protein
MLSVAIKRKMSAAKEPEEILKKKYIETEDDRERQREMSAERQR